MNTKQEYFEECLASSFEEYGIDVTEEQLKFVAADVAISVDCMDMAFHVPENPLIRETEVLKYALDKEKSKRVCSECKGVGTIYMNFLNRCSISRCDRCCGEGKV